MRCCFIFIAFVSLLCSCKRTLPVDDADVLVKVKDRTLGRSEIKQQIPRGLSSADSMLLAGSLEKKWVKDALVYDVALRNLEGEDKAEVDKRHVEENEIERPEDLRVRTVANKSKLKVSIIQRIDRKVALDEIAMTNGLEFNELLDEIEAIVYSGTRINIDYFLNDVMDEDHIDDIYEYFKDSETDDLEDAIEELGGDYTEEEIRLVRIKFLSEMAN
jgi:uncharacterized protein (DUF433 family)